MSGASLPNMGGPDKWNRDPVAWRPNLTFDYGESNRQQQAAAAARAAASAAIARPTSPSSFGSGPFAPNLYGPGGSRTPANILANIPGVPAPSARPREESGMSIAEIMARMNQATGGGGGGVAAPTVSFTPLTAPRDAVFTPGQVDRSLYQLEESAAERQALIDARADLDARARAGAEAIVGSWTRVEETNRLAADKARAMASQYAGEAAGLWVNAANQAREASVLRAAAAMANQGRAPIDLDPMAGGGAFIAAMESLARPEAERAFAEGQMQAERSEFMGDLAAAQSAAYQGELQRTSMIMAADMAREHNNRVLERIGRERLSLQDAERQTDLFNRQLQSQIERENIERAFMTDQFNIQNRMQADQFNAQMRQAASAAARSGQSQEPFSQRLMMAAFNAASLGRTNPRVAEDLLIAEFGIDRPTARDYIASALVQE